MSDVQARAAEIVCRSLHPTRWEYHASPCEPCAHVAAALAEAGLLADHAYCNERVDRADQRTDAARSELAEITKQRDELGEGLTRVMQRLADAGRRGAVAALLNLWPSMVEFVRASGRAQVLIAKDARITEKHLSRMLNHREGSLDTWQRVLHAAAADRLTKGEDRG